MHFSVPVTYNKPFKKLLLNRPCLQSEAAKRRNCFLWLKIHCLILLPSNSPHRWSWSSEQKENLFSESCCLKKNVAKFRELFSAGMLLGCLGKNRKSVEKTECPKEIKWVWKVFSLFIQFEMWIIWPLQWGEYEIYLEWASCKWGLTGGGQKCKLQFWGWNQNCNFHWPEKRMCYQVSCSYPVEANVLLMRHCYW